jgi:uncharacterized protein YkwD
MKYSTSLLTSFLAVSSFLGSSIASPVVVYEVEHNTVYILDGVAVSTAVNNVVEDVVTPTTTSTPTPTPTVQPVDYAAAYTTSTSSSSQPAVAVYVETYVSTYVPATTSSTSTTPTSTYVPPATTLLTTSTSSTQAPASTQGSSSTDSYAQSIVDAHNTDRSAHSAPAMAWNETLADFAQNFLDNQNCVFAHSGGPYGENLAWGYDDAADGIAAWYAEGASYSYADATFSDSTGHFTQVVWVGSTQVGCATVTCSGSQFLACEYYPRGNMLGEFSENVLPN